MVGIALKALIRREREAAQARATVLEKLDTAVNSIDTDADEQDFIDMYKSESGGIFLSSQALSILSDGEKGILTGQESPSSSPIERARGGRVEEDCPSEEVLGECLAAIFYAEGVVGGASLI